MSNKELRTCVFYDPEAEKFDDEYGCQGHFVPGRSDSPYCPRCRHNLSDWTRKEKKRPGAMRRYRNRIACRHARLDEWSGESHRYSKGKVVSITNARKRHA